MATNYSKMMLARMKLTYEAIDVGVSNDGQGIFMIDDFA